MPTYVPDLDYSLVEDMTVEDIKTVWFHDFYNEVEYQARNPIHTAYATTEAAVQRAKDLIEDRYTVVEDRDGVLYVQVGTRYLEFNEGLAKETFMEALLACGLFMGSPYEFMAEHVRPHVPLLADYPEDDQEFFTFIYDNPFIDTVTTMLNYSRGDNVIVFWDGSKLTLHDGETEWT